MVSIVIFWQQEFRDSIRLWMQVREDDGRFHGMWEFPGGGIDEGETAQAAAIREIDEEVGIKLDEEDKIKLFKIYHNDFKQGDETKRVHLHTFVAKTNKIPEGKGKWFDFETEKDVDQLVGNTPDANPAIIKELMKYLENLKNKEVDQYLWN